MKLFVVFCVSLAALAAADDCNVAGTDVWFGDIYSFYANSFQDCKDRCRGDDRCEGVVYYHWGFLEGKCFLKDNSHWGRIGCAWCTAAFQPCINQEGPCPAGQYKSSARACSSCPHNTYSAHGASSCTACPPGHFSRAGSSSCSECPIGTFNGVNQGSCETCLADTYNDETGAAHCKPCGDGYVSPAGSTSTHDCELLNGAHCWVLYDNVRLTGVYSDKMSHDEANEACFEDANCTGISCRRRRGDIPECYLASGVEHEEERKKWYTSVKEC